MLHTGSAATRCPRLQRLAIGLPSLLAVAVGCIALEACGSERTIAPPKSQHHIRGIVQDEAGVPASGFRATLTGPGVDESTLTDALGEFLFPRLPEARYEVVVLSPEGWSMRSPDHFVIDLRQNEHVQVKAAREHRQQKAVASDTTTFATGSGGRVELSAPELAGAQVTVTDLDSIAGVGEGAFLGGVSVSLSGALAPQTAAPSSPSSSAALAIWQKIPPGLSIDQIGGIVVDDAGRVFSVASLSLRQWTDPKTGAVFPVVGGALGVDLAVGNVFVGFISLRRNCPTARSIDPVYVSGPDATDVILVHGWQPKRFICDLVEDYDAGHDWQGTWSQIKADHMGHVNIWVMRYPTFNHIAEAGSYLAQWLTSHDIRGAIVVGHSMGGLVARAAAQSVGDRIARVITLGTPHKGTPTASFFLDASAVAGFVASLVGSPGATSVVKGFTAVLDSDGLRDLVPNSSFLSTLGSTSLSANWSLAGVLLGVEDIDKTSLAQFIYFCGFQYLAHVLGEQNDGLVPASSALASPDPGRNVILRGHDHSELLHGDSDQPSAVAVTVSDWVGDAIKPPPRDLVVDPPSIQFDTVALGQTVQTSLTLSNTSASSGAISGTLAISGSSAFSFQGGSSFSLSSGQSTTVAVRFSPTGTGDHTGNLIISHDATNVGNPYVVPLSGTGKGKSDGAQQLAVYGSGTGQGTITSNPSGITCLISGSQTGGTCTATFPYSTTVVLTAAGYGGDTFAGWSGDCSGRGSCTLTMTQAWAVTATFTAAPQQLTVYGSGAGQGTITSSPSGITCLISGNETGGSCTASFPYNTNVILTAAGYGGDTFAGWSGDCSGSGSCTLAMTQAWAVTATFTAAPQQLAIYGSGTGQGTITSSPSGINCLISNGSQSGSCQASFPYNTTVVLTANEYGSDSFGGWSGDCSGSGSCTLTMIQPWAVTATFTAAPQQLMDMSVSPSSLSFGSVALGQVSDLSLTISNSASSTTDLVYSPSVSGASYALVNGAGNFSVPPGQSATVTVRFAPTAATSHPGTLSIIHTATNVVSPLSIPLSGSGASQNSSTGTIVSTLKNVGGSTAPAAGTRQLLYTSPRQSVTGSNPATFSSVPAGSYTLEGYSMGALSWGEEFWASQTVTVTAAQTTNVVLTRTYPYASSAVIKNDATGQRLTAGQIVPLGTRLRAEVTVRNNVPGVPLPSSMAFVFDRNQSGPYDFDQTSAAQSVSGSGGSKLYTFTYTPSAGQYSFTLGVRTTLANGNTWLTDSGPWNQTVNVQ